MTEEELSHKRKFWNKMYYEILVQAKEEFAGYESDVPTKLLQNEIYESGISLEAGYDETRSYKKIFDSLFKTLEEMDEAGRFFYLASGCVDSCKSATGFLYLNNHNKLKELCNREDYRSISENEEK